MPDLHRAEEHVQPRLFVSTCVLDRIVDAEGPRFWNYPPDVAALFTPDTLGPELFDAAKHTVGHVGTIFPNTSLLSFPSMQTPKIEPQTRPLTRPISADPEPRAPTETWGATANGPVVE